MRGLKRLVYNVHIFRHQEPSKVLIPDTQHRCQLARSYGSSLYKQGLLYVSASGPFLLSIQTYSSLFLLSVLRAIPTLEDSSGFQVWKCPTHIHSPTSMETVFAYKVFHFDRCSRLGFRFYPFFKLFHTRHTLSLLTRIVTQQVQTQKRNSSYAGFVRPPLSKKYWNTIPPAKHIKFVFGLPRSTTGEPDELNASHIHGERFVRFGLPATIAKIEKAFVLGFPPETKAFSHIIAITHFVIFSQMPAEF